MEADDLRDLLAGLGPFGIRRLFGGLGLYDGERIFGVVLRGTLYLKADAASAPAFAAAGAEQWTYAHRRGGNPVAMPYWRMPEAGLDDPDEAVRWARLGMEAAARELPKSRRPKSARAASARAKPARRPD